MTDDRLSPEHRRMLEVDSKISPQVIEARGYATVRSVKELTQADVIGYPYASTTPVPGPDHPNDPDDYVSLHVRYLVGRKGHFTREQLRFPALLIPVWWKGQLVAHRLRPDRPRVNGRPIKYEQQTGLDTHLDANPAAWGWVIDPSLPVAITEGEKKADALTSAGVPAVSVPGVWNWQREKAPHPEWADVPVEGRTVHLVFDSDYERNDHVRLALVRLSDLLRGHGAKVYWTFPLNGAKGVDDYLAAGGTWQEMVAQSTAPNPLRFRTLAKVRRTRQPVSWLVRDALLADAFAVIGGAEKTLKSWLMVAFAIAVAAGRPLFCDERFAVPTRRRVLVLTGEGTAGLFLDRLDHLCKLCKIDPADMNEWVAVTDAIESSSSEVFKTGLRTAVEDFDPGLVVLDPAFVYLDAADQAGNVFKMGKLLADLRDLCRGRAVLVGHHFTKVGRDDLTLSSLTQAGFREAFDHWLLMAHASDPDLDAQTFRLRARLGARRGFGWDATFEVTLGPFDLDQLQHTGEPKWQVTRGQPAAEDGTDWRREVYQEIRDQPWELTQKDLMSATGDHPGSRRTALNWLKKRGVVITKRVQGPKGERAADRFGPVLDIELEDATSRLGGDAR